MNKQFNPSFREFLIALDFIFKWEGGAVNYQSDYGGLTNVGITQAAYNTYCKRTNKLYKSVLDLSEVDILDFYWLDRYVPCGAINLPYPLSLVIFDTSILFSVESSYSFINEYLYKDPNDYSTKGLNHLIQTVKSGLSSTEIAQGLCDCREKEHRHVSNNDYTQSVFLDGWLNRLNDLRNIITQYKTKNRELWRCKIQISLPS